MCRLVQRFNTRHSPRTAHQIRSGYGQFRSGVLSVRRCCGEEKGKKGCKNEGEGNDLTCPSHVPASIHSDHPCAVDSVAAANSSTAAALPSIILNGRMKYPHNNFFLQLLVTCAESVICQHYQHRQHMRLSARTRILAGCCLERAS